MATFTQRGTTSYLAKYLRKSVSSPIEPIVLARRGYANQTDISDAKDGEPITKQLAKTRWYENAMKGVEDVHITEQLTLPSKTLQSASAMNISVGFNWADPTKGDIDYECNDTLALGHDPSVCRAQGEYIIAMGERSSPSWVGKSGIFAKDELSPVLKFQREAAEWMNSDLAILTTSGMSANGMLMETLLKNNTDVPVYLDSLVHTTFRYGISAINGKMLMFKHNNVNALENLMKEHGPGFVVVDSVYSSLGTIAPLHDLCEVTEKYGSSLVVDESHALGTYGDSGNGIVCKLGLEHKVAFRTASLSKGFATNGGLICAPKSFKKIFRVITTKNTFSNAVQDYEAVRLLKILDIVKQAQDRRRSLNEKSTYLKSNLMELGYSGYYMKEPTHIFGLCAGDFDTVVGLGRALKHKGIHSTAFTYPAAPRTKSLLRWIITEKVTWEQLDYTLDVLDSFIKDGTAKPLEWPDYKKACY
ncbi:unnamed protein product [Owenia fusiformis]|uniref:Aminotransferase class I/classII large domain-containing protein n=1 Tax=Owenia fusiformis TaxID=6347 RepID=A0A8S4PGD2_OWEFU|nr:unnamed protein product [Owenia fusiformis]